jgi:hypothetical protein
MPGADQFYASPELQRLIGKDSTVAALFSPYTMLGTIEYSGLTQPHELRAIIGLSSDEQLLVPVRGFGTDQLQGPGEDNTRLNTVVAILVMFAIWIPGIVFIAIITRLASRSRQHRARSMRLLGITRTVTRLIHAVETMLVTLPAAILGYLLYTLLIHAMTRLPGTSFGYFTSDVGIPAWQSAVIILLFTALAGASTAFSLRLDRQDASAVATRSPRRLAGIGLVVLLIGLVYMIAIPIIVVVGGRDIVRGTAGAVVAYGMWTGCGAVAIGFAFTGPHNVARTFTWAAVRARAGGTLVGLRLHSTGSATTLKLGSMLGVIIIVMLGTLSFVSIFNGGSSKSWDDALATHKQVPVIVNDLGGSLTWRGVTELYPSGGAVQVQQLGRSGNLSVVFGSCSDLERLSGSKPAQCTDKPQWIQLSGGGEAPHIPTGGSVKVPGARKLVLPKPSDVTRVKRLPEEFNGALLLPPRLAADRAARNSSYFFLLVRNVHLNETLAKLSALSPTAAFDLGELDRHNPDLREFPAQLQWLPIGSGISLLVGGLALSAATLAETRDRSQRMYGLHLLGTPRSHLIRAHFWSAGAPLLLLGWAATLIGWTICRCLHAFDDRAVVGVATIGLTALGVAAVGLAVTILTLPDVLGAQRPGVVES